MCAVDGCKRVAYARDYCNPHYQRWRRGTSMTKPLRTQRIVCDMPYGGPCKMIWPASRFAWCKRCKAR